MSQNQNGISSCFSSRNSSQKWFYWIGPQVLEEEEEEEEDEEREEEEGYEDDYEEYEEEEKKGEDSVPESVYDRKWLRVVQGTVSVKYCRNRL